ncbi:uncharacterized protein LOC127717861 isoform X2 [Mytilus californianus]|uniref:uncharacterized protein LOC127717861 isoform X2 n=1 Tax=Mytilus californianus TaxID=6549 RepID=UPI0022450DD4|nr:uncharacterized protein LOC127717861 isoform X2 [Mytilus californianus]
MFIKDCLFQLLLFHRMHFIHVTMLYIFMISISPSSVAGNIKWTLKEKPALFGANIHLVCHLPNKTLCCDDDRKWNVGYQYNLVIINGFSYNETKYEEDLNVKERVSVLTVFSLSEKDVNIPYECVYGFQKYRSTLELTEDVFEFLPTEKLPVVPEIRGFNVRFNIQFEKVFPEPLCRAALGIQNLSSFLSVTVGKNDLFYQSSLAFIYSRSEKACTDSLKVLCTVGKTVLTVVDHKMCSSAEGKESFLLFIIVITIVAVILILTTGIVCVRKALSNWREHHRDKTTEEEISLNHPIHNQL